MGATYKNKAKLTKKEQGELFIKLAKAISLLRSPEEVAYFLKDLLTEAEVYMLARRLQIAEMLIMGFGYEFIKKELKVGDGTIARVQMWLEVSGDGYRTVVKRIRIDTKQVTGGHFTQHKRRYPMYYWPELLLKEIIKSANKKEKERLNQVLIQLKEKTALTEDLKKILNS